MTRYKVFDGTEFDKLESAELYERYYDDFFELFGSGLYENERGERTVWFVSNSYGLQGCVKAPLTSDVFGVECYPFDFEVTLNLGDESITVTFSNFSSTSLLWDYRSAERLIELGCEWSLNYGNLTVSLPEFCDASELTPLLSKVLRVVASST